MGRTGKRFLCVVCRENLLVLKFAEGGDLKKKVEKKSLNFFVSGVGINCSLDLPAKIILGNSLHVRSHSSLDSEVEVVGVFVLPEPVDLPVSSLPDENLVMVRLAYNTWNRNGVFLHNEEAQKLSKTFV